MKGTQWIVVLSARKKVTENGFHYQASSRFFFYAATRLRVMLIHAAEILMLIHVSHVRRIGF
jgi:hypothetical protein